MILSRHAELRSQERHISPMQLEWLISYGQESHNRGVCLFHFDRDSYLQLLREVNPEHLELALRSRNIYAVIADITVVTVGYRDQRLKPQKSPKRIRRGSPTQPAARRIQRRTR